ncbi:MAG: T9SS C-terminal target domain-containing protein, partial [Flavobacterium sp.]
NNSCTECYEVFELPVENPYYGERTIVEQPWHPLASPYGWHDLNGEPGADHTRTFGNNVFLKTYGGHITEGSELLNFTGFPLDTIINDQQRWEDAASTNAFYIVNSIHDIFYIYGFNEEARNFQKNNYGRGGLDDDPAQVFIQVDDSGCGSSYEYTEDGESPTIRLGICGSKDAAVDADVVIHEYVHGLSTRLVFAGELFYCLGNRENLGEGISDWYAKVLTIKPEETRDDHQGFGNYIQGKGPDGIGTNLYHYSTDMSVNPLTYGDITNYPFSYHKIGAVWATMLWEITWNLIDEYGFDPNVYNFTGTQADAGNIRAIAIVTEAMKLMPCRPGFVSGRDAIIAANKQLYGGYGECLIWDGFAKRGVGLYAEEGTTESVGDEIVDFTTMPREIEFDFNETLCINTGYENYEGGLPYGGVYSGEGVFDHGDGKSFHIYTVGLEEGVYEVLYTIESTDCHTASTALGYYEIIEDTVAPVPTCLEELTQVVEIQDEYLLWDYTGIVEIEESCSLTVEVTQDPPPETIVDPGIIPLKFTLVDESGNESYCETILNLIELEEVVEEDYNFAMTPNPTSGRVYLKNLTGELMRSATIYDMLGRTVLYFDLSATQHETELVVESLVQGVYFVKFEFDKAEIVKQLVKK